MCKRTVAFSLALMFSAPAATALAAQDAGPSVVAIDASPAAAAHDTSVAVEAPAPDDKIDTELGVFKRGLEAIKGDHVWRDLAALALILLGLLAKRFDHRLPSIFQGGTGKFLLVTALAAVGAIGHAALAGHSFMSGELWRTALAVLAEAVVGYEAAKRIAKKVRG